MTPKPTWDDEDDPGQEFDEPNNRSSAERVAAHARRRRAAGLVRVSIWVPNQRADEIQETARRMRVEAGIPLPLDRPRSSASSPSSAATRATTPAVDDGPTLVERRPGLPGLP